MGAWVMSLSRRQLIAAMGLLTPLAGVAAAKVAPSPDALPDRSSFPLDQVYLDAAFTHPFGQAASAAASAYVQSRQRDPQSVSPRQNARNAAVERFARLINADAADIAVVPSTMEGENLVNISLGVGADAGVVTDALHYDGSLALYGELQRRGVPLGVARPRGTRIDLADLRALLTRGTRLVAVSLVSSVTGFEYDLGELCALAHEHGALVYADIVQAAGAVPIDVKASGVDFAACGTYKWLMGDFGTAFLYVRPDRVDRLTRQHVGWRQLRQYESHVLPFEPSGPALGTYQLAPGAAGLFEVGTPAWEALACVAGSLDYIASIGVDAIVRHRQPLLQELQARLPPIGFTPLTPKNSRSPIVAFACKDAQKRFAAPLRAQKIRISIYENRIRISPSVYNTLDDITHLVSALVQA
jgi:selenocysteine lyase/cysteine desulfurase